VSVAAGLWAMTKGASLSAFGVLLDLLRKVPRAVWLVLLALALVKVYGCSEFRRGERVGNARADEIQAQWNAERVAVKKAYDAAVAKQRADAKKQKKAMRWIKADIKKDLHDAKRTGKAVAADVRAGRLRLRDHWTCPAVPKAGPVAGPAAGGDAAAERRAGGAGDLVRIAADADARLRACQRVILADRGQLDVPPKPGD
jgi:hypothetical protein